MIKKILLSLLISSFLFVSISYAQHFAWRNREHATDCTSLTDGRARDICFEEDSERLFKCEPTGGADIICDSAAEWKLTAGTASLTLAGVVELATTAEINTGTDTERAMGVDEFQASDRNMRHVALRAIEPATDVTATTDVFGDWISPVAGVIQQSDTTKEFLSARCDTAGTTGTMVVDIHLDGTTIMTTNKLDIESTEQSTTTATTQPDLTTTAISIGSVITVDIDAIHTTACKGLTVYLTILET